MLSRLHTAQLGVSPQAADKVDVLCAHVIRGRINLRSDDGDVVLLEDT